MGHHDESMDDAFIDPICNLYFPVLKRTIASMVTTNCIHEHKILVIKFRFQSELVSYDVNTIITF